VLLIQAASFDAIPMAGFTWTWPPLLHTPDDELLVKHHREMLMSITPTSAMTAMAMAMIPNESSTYQPLLTSTSTSTATATIAVAPSATGTSVANGNGRNCDTSSSLPLSSVYHDDQKKPMESKTVAISVNTAMIALYGYSGEEMKSRMEIAGWRFSLRFAHPDDAAAFWQNCMHRAILFVFVMIACYGVICMFIK
jgi:hypothetical protein